MDYTSFYQPGVPAEVDPPTESLVEMYETAVEQSKNRVAMNFFGRTTTYEELGDQVSRVAEGLHRLGVSPGDRVAIILPNCPQHVVAFYAILRLGAIVVEHNPLYTARELRHMFEDHAARIVIAWDSAVEKLREQPHDIQFDHIISVNLLHELPWTKRLALKLPLPQARAARKKLTTKVKRTQTWEELLNHHPLKKTYPKPRVTDVAMIQYTSGTTGLPKGAILTHLNLHINALQGAAWMPQVVTGKEVFYAILPFFHAFGTTMFLVFGLLKQARIHIFPTFDLALVLAAAKKDPPTVVCAVPPIFEAIALGAKKRHVSLKSAKISFSGAMSLPTSIIDLWESIAGGPLVEGYGMTECSPVALGNPFFTTRRAGSVGIPFPSTQIKVVDPDNPAIEVNQGERGELLVRGPQVFQGYWNNPEETEKTLLPDGWIASGDIVTQDADGFTTIVDRKKELIITSGFNVAPTEVELVLKSYPAIADAAVVGLPNRHSGEEVVAAIQPQPGHTINDDDIRTFCRDRLAAYKVPRKLFVVDTLPKSLLGKVLRAQVRQDLLTRK
ncbi:MAG: long-chain-fatty-acid--CoA ligase [Propionibacteriaceae bacterium]|nr:long-chain-fatty-acid--CoA ligase [Propionibacteriaceae bacterium]